REPKTAAGLRVLPLPQPPGDTWTVGIDSTVVRAHHDATGARRRPPVDVPAGRLVGVLEDATAASGHTGGSIE
ncbi:MAG: hypothetical protein KY460_16690, partial [Actinobacteria bacterium]|nr:hypothetical protein [Actinomycetota bacterium]